MGGSSVQSAPLAQPRPLFPGQQHEVAFDLGQGLVGNNQLFSGLPDSTMKTMGSAGALMGQAQQYQALSQADLLAQQNFLNQQFQGQQEAQQAKASNLSSGAGSLGSVLGSLGGA